MGVDDAMFESRCFVLMVKTGKRSIEILGVDKSGARSGMLEAEVSLALGIGAVKASFDTDASGGGLLDATAVEAGVNVGDVTKSSH